jgi:steroid delta-isomerase-like uncharacterized protein
MRDEVQQIIDSVVELWNTGHADAALRAYNEDAERNDPNLPGPIQGANEIAEYVTQIRTGFPDFRLEVTDQVAEGDRLVVHWTGSGTNRGEFLGIPATGHRMTLSGTAWSRIVNGKIAEERVYFDRLSMLEQLGVSPDAMRGQAKRAMG